MHPNPTSQKGCLCLPDTEPTWDDLNKRNKELDENLNNTEYKKMYDF